MADQETPRERESSSILQPTVSPRQRRDGNQTPPSSARRSARAPFSSRGAGGGIGFTSTLARTPRTPRVSSEPLHVAIKIRPPADRKDALDYRIVDGTQLMLLGTVAGGIEGSQEESRTYEFGNIFGADSSDDSLPNLVVPKVLEQLKLGYNSTILCYGQTGSGKTHSINNLLPKCVESVFQHIDSEAEESPDISYIVEVSFLQIYNGNVFNLLSEKKTKSSSVGPRANADDMGEPLPKPKGYLVPEPCFVVKNSQEAVGKWSAAQKKRVTSGHAMNHRSSRSHCVFSLHVAKLLDGTPIQGSKITLVDLAGSERLKKTEVEGKDQKAEAISINTSLTTLQRTIKEIAEGNPNPPFRDNILTLYLAGSLSDSCNIIVACVSVEPSNYNETKNTLEFGTVAKKCVVTRSKNFQRIAGKRGNFEAAFEQLKQEILSLRNKLEVLQQEADLERQRNRMLILQQQEQQKIATAAGSRAGTGGISSSSAAAGGGSGHGSNNSLTNSPTSPHPVAFTHQFANNNNNQQQQQQQSSASAFESDKVVKRIQELEKQSCSFNNLLREKEDELRQLDSKRGDAESLAADLQDQVNQMEEAREMLASELDDGRVSEEKEQYQQLQEKFAKLNESFLWQDERYNEMQEKNQVLEMNLKNLQKTIQRQNGELHEAHVNALKWEEQLATSRGEVRTISEAKQKLQQEFDDLELTWHREKIEAQMKAKANQLDEKNELLRRTELEELQNAITEQKALQASLSERAKLAEESVLELQQEKVKAEERANAAEQAYRNFDRRSSFADRRHISRGFTGSEPLPAGANPYEIVNLKKQISAQAAEKAATAELMKGKDHQISEMQQKLEQALTDLNQTKQEFKCLQQLEETHSLNGELFEKKLNEVYDELEANISERENLERQLDKRSREVSQVEGEFRASIIEIEKLQTEMEHLSQKLRSYESSNDELSARLREATEEAATFQRERSQEHEKVKELMLRLKEQEEQSEELYANLQAGHHHQSMLSSLIANRRRNEKHIISRLGDANRERGGSRAISDGRHQKMAARVRDREQSNSQEGTRTSGGLSHVDPQQQLVFKRFAVGTRSQKIKENISSLQHKEERRAALSLSDAREPAVTFHQYTAMSPNASAAPSAVPNSSPAGGGVGPVTNNNSNSPTPPMAGSVNSAAGPLGVPPLSGASRLRTEGIIDNHHHAPFHHNRTASTSSGGPPALATPRGDKQGGGIPSALATPREKGEHYDPYADDGPPHQGGSRNPRKVGVAAASRSQQVKFKNMGSSKSGGLPLPPSAAANRSGAAPAAPVAASNNARTSNIQAMARQKEVNTLKNTRKGPAIPTLALAKASQRTTS